MIYCSNEYSKLKLTREWIRKLKIKYPCPVEDCELTIEVNIYLQDIGLLTVERRCSTGHTAVGSGKITRGSCLFIVGKLKLAALEQIIGTPAVGKRKSRSWHRLESFPSLKFLFGAFKSISEDNDLNVKIFVNQKTQKMNSNIEDTSRNKNNDVEDRKILQNQGIWKIVYPVDFFSFFLSLDFFCDL